MERQNEQLMNPLTSQFKASRVQGNIGWGAPSVYQIHGSAGPLYIMTYMYSSSGKPAQLSTLLSLPQLSARPGLPGIWWAAPATAPTVPEHSAERGWNGNRQLMGTQRMVKTFSSGDGAVWRFLSGTWPSQRPVALSLVFFPPLCLLYVSLCLFFSSLAHFASLHFTWIGQGLSCFMFGLFQPTACLSLSLLMVK